MGDLCQLIKKPSNFVARGKTFFIANAESVSDLEHLTHSFVTKNIFIYFPSKSLLINSASGVVNNERGLF